MTIVTVYKFLLRTPHKKKQTLLLCANYSLEKAEQGRTKMVNEVFVRDCEVQSIPNQFTFLFTSCFPDAPLEDDCVVCCIHDFLLICSTKRAKNYKQQNKKR